MVGLTADTGKNKGTLAADIDYFVKFLAGFALLQAAAVFAGSFLSPSLPFHSPPLLPYDVLCCARRVTNLPVCRAVLQWAAGAGCPR